MIRIVTLLILLSHLTILLAAANNSDNVDQLREIIAQKLIIGFRGVSLCDTSSIVKDITVNKIGGVILFDYDVALKSYDRNISSPEQLKNLTDQLQKYGEENLIIAIDQEGGKVCRLKTAKGFPKNVSAAYLGNINNPDSTRYYAALTASTLAELGINLNFSPVVDLNSNPDNPVIGKINRSFSADQDIVVQNAGIFIEEFTRAGILGTLKHFPGHGSSAADSHTGFTDVSLTWQIKELDPYYNLINSGKVDLVMTAHVYNANIDKEYPATLSQKTMQILRNDIGFKGVIVSDDMNMGAVAETYSLKERLELVINAGVDILVFGNNLVYDQNIADVVITTVMQLIEEGKINKSELIESNKRIQKIKEKIRKK